MIRTSSSLIVLYVVEPWNNLPQEVVCAASVDDFKELIDQYSSNSVCN